MDFLSFLFEMLIFLVFVAGIVAVIYLIVKIQKTSKIIEHVTSKEYTLLRILVPKLNDKTPQAAEEMFASIHGIFRADQAIQDHLSFEIAAKDQYIQFFCYVPKELKDYVEGQIYAQYPTLEISEVQDYTDVNVQNSAVAAAELVLINPDYYPIKTFNNFQVDPLAGVTSVLSKIDEGEQIWVQMLVRPIADTWQSKTLAYVKMVETGDKPKDNSITIGKILRGTVGVVGDVVRMAATGNLPEKKEEKKEKPNLPGPVVEGLRAAEAKTTKLGFEVTIRVCAIGRDEASAANKINGLLGAFKQYNVTNMNGFSLSKISTEKDKIMPVFQTRAFPTNGFIFNVEELASIYHFPSTSVETPSIVWAGAKKGEPPANLPIEGLAAPDDVTLFGKTNYRHFNHRFGIKTPDRRYHMYAIGKTGTGKSTMLRNMIIDDIQKGRGICVVDPHGDLISHVLDYIPDDRVNDVVYFNPADREHPVGFNLLESVDPDLKSIVASGLMSIFTKLWANVWSARMEYILRNTVLALLEYPNATLLEIMKMLVDPVFRRKVLYYVKDPVIRDFFLNEFEKYEPKFRTEAIAPIQNKVGQFLSSSTIRNIMGQIHSTIDMREIMDSGKILLVDLSVGKIGEDNAALLGSMIITKIQLAAMGRADIPEEERRDFYLYVDEFQNFATDSFAVILSEARKYHLNLIITHQYIAQMPEVVASAVFGNVGTIVAFRIGAADATALQKEFEPVFDANDLVNLDNYHVYLKMAIDARTAVPFSAVTLPPFTGKNENRDKSINESIRKYTVKREDIEKEITDRNEANSGTVGTFSEVDGQLVYSEELKPYEPMNPLPKNEVIDGKDLWKVRDKEGKPYYVIDTDYDAYMYAKGKESDRPGAAPMPTPVDPELIDPESVTSPRQSSGQSNTSQPNNSGAHADAKANKANSHRSDHSSKKRHDKHDRRHDSDRRDTDQSNSGQPKGDGGIKKDRGDAMTLSAKYGAVVDVAPITNTSVPPVETDADSPVSASKTAMGQSNIVRHNNQESNTDLPEIVPVLPLPVELSSTQVTEPVVSAPVVDDLVKIEESSPGVQVSISSNAPSPDIITQSQASPHQPPSNQQTVDIAAKYNDFDDRQDDEILPLQEL